MTGIYVHIPFCRKICNYCDFYKMVVSDRFKKEYVEYLIKDLKLTKTKYGLSNVDTLYFGGGTPSCLPLDSLEKILIEFSNSIDLRSLQEFTFEVNPEDLNFDLIKLLKKYCVNRISIGVQTFNNKFYSLLGRVTDYSKLEQGINLLKEAGITNYSFDLIYAIPNQTLNDLKDDIEKMFSLKPNHISTYSLILEERSILYHKLKESDLSLVDDKLDSAMYDFIKDTLLINDFSQYETSNFSKLGYESKHNLIYWNCDNYYGIGTASASLINDLRITKVSNIRKYYEMLDNELEPVVEYETLDERRLMEDFVMLGLRKNEGINVSEFEKRFSKNIFSEFSQIEKLIESKTLIYDNNYLKINEDFTYISNYVISKILFD